MSAGTLYLLPVPLADGAEKSSYTAFHQELINGISEYVVENEKTARRFLKSAGLTIPQSELVLHVYGKQERQQRKVDPRFFEGLLSGRDVGLMSEAGCPGIADPGAELVREAHRLGIRVVPLVGPNSMILALMASGMDGQSFAFHGYLPIDKAARTRRIKQLERLSKEQRQTQLFMETPFRNNQLLEDVLKACSADTRLCVACQLTAPDEQIISDTISGWKKRKTDFHKKPAIFLIG